MQVFSFRKITTAYVVWCVCWIVLQTLVLRSTFAFDWMTSLKDAAVTNFVNAIVGYEIILILRYYQPNQLIRLAMSVVLALICAFATEKLAPILVTKDFEYVSFLERSFFIRVLFSWLMITLISTISWLWFSVKEQHDLATRKEATEKLARDAELSRLRQQLQPHFLFNSLNSISALAGSRPEEARKMIQQLSDFLRGTLKKDDQQLVTFSEEIEHLRLYLEIEKVRFGHRLKTEITYDESALSLKLPSLLLQPVVENAIKFGLYDTTGETVIELNGKNEDGFLSISVKNPFDPTTAQPKQGTGFGLSSIQRRLYLLFARQDLVSTQQLDNLFVTQIKIPQTI
jgi:two-component system, LytTR family, sensor kinase